MTAPPYILVQLIHIHGGLKGEIQEFYENVVTVGRLSSCSVKFAAQEPGVSREHARIQREGNQFRLVDLSKYGTWVNGKPAKEVMLKNGDVLEFGPGGPKVSITMEVVAALPPSAAPGYSSSAAAQPVFPAPVYERPRQEPAPAAPSREVYQDQTPPREAYQAPMPPREAQQVPMPPREAQQAQTPPREVYQGQTPPQMPFVVQKTMTALVIQFGPTIRSFRELPVTLGADPRADFVIRHPGIQDQHAQIFFSQNCYCIKDLTGQGLLKLNQRCIGTEVPLRVNDEIECGPQGPVFRFLGEGRLAEVEPVQAEPAALKNGALVADTPLTQKNGNFFSKLAKGFKP